MWSKLVLLLLHALMMSRQNVINLAQGQIRGVLRDGFVIYTGIPYASISSSNGKFKGASIAPTWYNIRESKTSKCSSVSDPQECLTLDVNVPAATASRWPVLVWITGGSGSYNPRRLVQEGIIVVIVFHRHGPQGFLCMSEDTIPGNAGIKDAVLALRWVRDNIVAFYGDPNKIIVAGQSFGAAMVDAIILSSMASGLFHGAILQSGTALCPWAFNYNAEERVKSMIDKSEEGTSEDIINFMLNVDSEELVTRANKLDVSYIPFGICSEKPLKNEERLLSKAPYDILTSKKVQIVPMIIGYNSNEAYVFMSILREANTIRRISRGPTFLIPEELKFLNKRERSQVARQIMNLYFNKNVTIASVLAYHRDAYFSSHIHRSVYHYSSSTPIYYYQFSHSSNIGVQSEPGVKKVGAAHSDELCYLFGDLDLDGEDGAVQRRLVKLWSNFIKHLNPTPPQSEINWEQTRPDHMRLMDISTNLKMIEYPYTKTTQMWDSVYEKYYYARNRIAN